MVRRRERKPAHRAGRRGGRSEGNMARNRERPDVRGLDIEELGGLVGRLGEPSYRARQIAEWSFKRGVRSFDEMTNLPKNLRGRLREESELTNADVLAEHTSKADGTRKLKLGFDDGDAIEAVLLRDDDRLTGCVSSQVGCKFGCSFCATGSMGFTRDLTAGEIVAEILALRADAAPERLNNLVFMGMGEPLDNYGSVMRAVRIVNARWGLGIGARRITVSTAGHVPGIRRLAGEGLQLELAVSLNAPNQSLRSTIMPIADVYSLTQLLAAIEYYSERTGRRATLEYVLLEGINDSPEMATELAAIARHLLCKVNLICYNKIADSVYAPPSERAVERFYSRVRKRCPTVVRRISRGDDIAAGCGQLCVLRKGTERR
jgi:23S rRNA (adenine2503-C2)-methyltransferase